MDHPKIPPQTYAFEANCTKCQKKVKKLLSRLDGVSSIKVEGDEGRVTVKSTVNPSRLSSIIGETIKEQEYSCEARTPQPNELENNNQMPIAAGIGQSLFKGKEGGVDLHKLAKTNKLKQLNLSMTFSEEKDVGPSQKDGTNALRHESKDATGSTQIGPCPPYTANDPSKFEVTDGGPYHTSPLYHHAPPPYHYPPPAYHYCPVPSHPPPPPPPAKANNVVLPNDSEPKCRMV